MRTSLPTPSLFLPTLLLCLLLSNALCGQTLTQKISQYNNQAISAYSQGDTLAALQWYYKELEATKQAYGEKDTLVAICYENIAQTYQALQVADSAVNNYIKALSILDNQTLRYKDILIHLFGTSISLGYLNEDSLPFMDEALKLIKKVLGENHQSYAMSLHGLASLYNTMGNYTAAEPLLKEALAIHKKVLGENHPTYATSLNNLASLYYTMGNYTDAEPLLKEALAIYKKVLGEEHPDYATSLNNLAELYRTTGNYTAAEPLYKEALAIYKKVLGENHPDYAGSLNNLAGLYNDMGNYTAAEPLYKEALAIRKKVLGENHPTYAMSLNNLAGFYYAMGN
jgi:tetratricopeptide (TPR) repeat protein